MSPDEQETNDHLEQVIQSDQTPHSMPPPGMEVRACPCENKSPFATVNTEMDGSVWMVFEDGCMVPWS